MQINSNIEYDNFDFYHMIEKYYKKIEKPYYPYILISKFIDYINDGNIELSNFREAGSIGHKIVSWNPFEAGSRNYKTILLNLAD